jgi:hypothetical protein
MKKMPDIHDRGRALAIRMLAPRPKGKGLELVLRKKTVGEYNPETGGQETTWAETDGSGLRTNYSQEDIDDTYILQGDVRILLSPVGLDGGDMPTPSTNDQIVFDTSTYNVIRVGPWDYAGVTCGYELQCRGL